MNKVVERYLPSIVRRQYFSIIFNEKVHTIPNKIWYIFTERLKWQARKLSVARSVGPLKIKGGGVQVIYAFARLPDE
jgi:hypothetical protein